MIKRDFTAIVIDPTDTYAFCATTTGDIIKIKLNLPPADGWVCDRQDPLGPATTGPLINTVINRLPLKCEMKTRNSHLYKGGITALRLLPSPDEPEMIKFLIGAGNGIVTEGVVRQIC